MQELLRKRGQHWMAVRGGEIDGGSFRNAQDTRIPIGTASAILCAFNWGAQPLINFILIVLEPESAVAGENEGTMRAGRRLLAGNYSASSCEYAEAFTRERPSTYQS